MVAVLLHNFQCFSQNVLCFEGCCIVWCCDVVCSCRCRVLLRCTVPLGVVFCFDVLCSVLLCYAVLRCIVMYGVAFCVAL